MTERPDQPLGADADDPPERSLSEATPWGDGERNVADLGEESIGAPGDAPDSDVEAATEVGDEDAPKDTDSIPNI